MSNSLRREENGFCYIQKVQLRHEAITMNKQIHKENLKEKKQFFHVYLHF